MALSDPLRGLVELCWPARCGACAAFVGEQSVFCTACDLTVYELGGDTCTGCAMPFDVGALDGERRDCCPGCARHPAPYARAEAAVLYGEAVAKAVVRMKHGGHRHLGRRLARLLAPALVRAVDGSAEPLDAILPVPLHPRKLRLRGFNQALELALWAHRIAGAGGRQVPLPPILRATLLRVRNTSELGHAGPAVRRREVAGAFAVAPGRRVENRRLLLVDDVMTTGATLGECARTLYEAGASRVDVLALARAP